jgi:hypothetical protein
VAPALTFVSRRTVSIRPIDLLELGATLGGNIVAAILVSRDGLFDSGGSLGYIVSNSHSRPALST